MNLNENERIDDLELNNLKIIQNTKWFCFGIDSVLLSGAGNGILELLLSAKIENSKITAIEVQKEVYELAKRNIVFNHLENRVIILNKNISFDIPNMPFSIFNANVNIAAITPDNI